MRFDSNAAWQQAAASVRASRDVLLAVAGVFILLPNLAFSLLFPQPTGQPGLTPEQMMDVMSAFYAEALPWFLPVVVLQGIGTLALLALLTDRRRPTVGEAIRLGALGLLSYLGAQLLLGLGVGLAGGLLLTLAAVTKSSALATAVLILLVLVMVYVSIRTSLLPAAIVVEGERRPVAALRRSWSLTAGNAGRIGLFFALLIIVALVLLVLIGGLFSLVGALFGGSGALVVNALVSASLSAVFSVYFIAIVAAIHRQLAGGGDSGPAAQLFD